MKKGVTFFYISISIIAFIISSIGILLVIMHVNNYSLIGFQEIYLPVFLLISIFLCLVAAVSAVYSQRIGKKLNESLYQIKSLLERINEENPINLSIFNNIFSQETNQIFYDISQLNQKLAKRMLNLRSEKDKFSFVLNSINEGFIAINCDNEIALLNGYAKKIFQITKDINGRNIALLTSNKEFLSYFTFEESNKVFKIAQNNRTFLCKTYSLNALDKESLKVAILSDITEEEQAAKIKATFFANASHELKTPITSVKGFTELLQFDQTLSEKNRKYLERTNQDITRLLNIVEDMLKLSKVENNEIQKLKEKIQLKELCENVARDFESQALLKNITVSVAGNAVVEFDKDQLNELISNLIDNAIKYNNNEGKVDVIIESGEKVVLKIKDNGIGIDSRHLDRIFERFYRIEKGRSRKMGGTGLGLAIVKHICLTNNAKIKVESNIGEGTQFTIEI